MRWAAKADEIGMTSSVTSACSPLRDEASGSNTGGQSIEQRSCSANQLDVIVDILGVPSELLNNKRLFLRKDKKENAVVLKRRPRRSKTMRNRPPLMESKSCETNDQETDLLMEVKRRSIYAKECRYVSHDI